VTVSVGDELTTVIEVLPLYKPVAVRGAEDPTTVVDGNVHVIGPNPPGLEVLHTFAGMVTLDAERVPKPPLLSVIWSCGWPVQVVGTLPYWSATPTSTKSVPVGATFVVVCDRPELKAVFTTNWETVPAIVAIAAVAELGPMVNLYGAVLVSLVNWALNVTDWLLFVGRLKVATALPVLSVVAVMFAGLVFVGGPFPPTKNPLNGLVELKARSCTLTPDWRNPVESVYVTVKEAPALCGLVTVKVGVLGVESKTDVKMLRVRPETLY